MDNLFFVAPYVSEEAERKMSCTPSSINYSKYLIDSFARLNGKKVRVLSLCTSKDQAYFSRKEVVLCNHTELYFESLPSRWGIGAIRFSQIWLYFQIFFYLLLNAQNNDTVVIYHDYGFSFFYKFFRRFIRCRFVCLVGEVFNAVYDRGEVSINKECRRLSNADAYIFSNDIMPNLFKCQKPYGVCYGNYTYYNGAKIIDNQIHVLYAGKISTGIINDAFTALEVIDFLPDVYILHIAGYGEKSDIEELKCKINQINRRYKTPRVSYEGNLSGVEYENLLAKCQFGLCTRTLRNELSNYCFPSKTLVYLTHDILPICPPIDILMSSSISSRLAFVEGDLTPKNIAETIIKHQKIINNYNNRILIESLDKGFLINELNDIVSYK